MHEGLVHVFFFGFYTFVIACGLGVCSQTMHQHSHFGLNIIYINWCKLICQHKLGSNMYTHLYVVIIVVLIHTVKHPCGKRDSSKYMNKLTLQQPIQTWTSRHTCEGFNHWLFTDSYVNSQQQNNEEQQHFTCETNSK